MELQEFIMQVLLIVIATFIPILGLALRRQMMSQAFFYELMQKEELVAKGVAFVEQFYFELNGPAKFDEALNWVSVQLQARGINFTVEELRGLIEAAVMALNEGWFEEEEE